MSQVTKRALEQSLKNLLLKKPLTKITINDIAEDCGINRMTFYYHFKDIYDLVEWSCLEEEVPAEREKRGEQIHKRPREIIKHHRNFPVYGLRRRHQALPARPGEL